MTERVRQVGRSLPRQEDIRLLTGRGQYFSDIESRQARAVGFIRGAVGHARIVSIDTAEAEAIPGVVGIYCGEFFKDCPELLSDQLLVPNLPGELRVPRRPVVSGDEVMYDGDIIGMVVAEDRYTLDDALATVVVKYDELPVVLDPEQALQPDAPKVYPEWPDNAIYRHRMHVGAVDDAFTSADVVVTGRYRQQRNGGQPMEPRGCLATLNRDGALEVCLTTQRPHVVRSWLARALNMPIERIHVRAPRDMGGAFGTKSPLYREDLLVCFLAVRTGLPLKWTETREEHLRCIGQERDGLVDIELALLTDGTVTAIRERILSDSGNAQVGIYMSVGMPFLGWLRSLGGYHIPNVSTELVCAVTHKPPLTPSRGFGRMPSLFAIERILDKAADVLGLDPVALRLKNVITSDVATNAIGLQIDSSFDLLDMFAQVTAALNYADFPARQAKARAQGRYLGFGIAVDVEPSGVPSYYLRQSQNLPGFGVATVTVNEQGRACVAVGDAPHGQGHETTLTQVVADELGMDLDAITIVQGNTDVTPYSAGAVASRSAAYTLNAAMLAARALRAKMEIIARHLLGLGPYEPLEAGDSRFDTPDGTRSISFSEVAQVALIAVSKLPKEVEPGLRHTSYFDTGTVAMSSASVHAGVVEVDPDSGRVAILDYVIVDDAGVRLNPMIVEGQTHGGMVMGLGATFSEEYRFDANGRQLSTTFNDYRLPTTLDVTPLRLIPHDRPHPNSPLGTKGKGEGAPVPVPAVIARGIENALAEFGVEVTSTPLHPKAVWQLVHTPAPNHPENTGD